jgi:hypothetical protein
MLHLAGTVQLPSPPPATGSVTIVAPGPGQLAAEVLMLALSHEISHRLFLERLIRLTDVRAIQAIWPPGPAQVQEQGTPEEAELEPTFKTASEIRALALAFAASFATVPPPIWLKKAVVYLPESAPVILRVEAGLTAAESADYYPPLISSGPHIRPRCDQIGCDLS